MKQLRPNACAGESIRIVNATNIDGLHTNPSQYAWPNIADGEPLSKWFDQIEVAVPLVPPYSSNLLLTLAAPAELTGYTFVTAKDVEKRSITGCRIQPPRRLSAWFSAHQFCVIVRAPT